MLDCGDCGAFARLSMIEFAIEIMMANQILFSSEADSEAFKRDFIDRFSTPRLGPASDSSEDEQLAERSRQMAERLIEKVADREAGIRAQRDQE
ncbi:MAG: hypothetical protein J6386_08820 [Candidatus Synoicihabitans palmerolidicus]|nr:hypothetical protein [Candidatus Synoicihabitans palmerolidicus]